MANRQHDNLLTTNREYSAMRGPSTQAEKEIANLVGKAMAFP